MKLRKEKEKAFILGIEAFKKGFKRIPAKDKELLNMLKNKYEYRESIGIIKTWCNGWDIANLSTNVSSHKEMI